MSVHNRNMKHACAIEFDKFTSYVIMYGKNKRVAHKVHPIVSLIFLSHFDVICDHLVNRTTTKRILSKLYDKDACIVNECI